jgi:ABC-type multidrug transport system fused ATPase/permease subunit
MVLGYDYPILGFFFSVLMIALFVIWLWLLDVFRSEDLNGWTKALWVIFVVLMPYLGVLVYLIARGGKMHERAVRGAVKHQQEFDDYVRQTASTGSTADELQKLAGLRDTGVISPEEFETQKAKLLA